VISKQHFISLSSFVLIVFFLLSGGIPVANAQANDEKETKVEANAVREEIQRYMGYEPLLPRYLTLPYDATTNTNVQSPYVDIGYLFMALIPILFLFGFRNRPWYGIACMILLLALLYISIGNGKIYIGGKFITTVQFANTVDNAANTFPSSIIKPIYKAVSNSYQGVNKFFKNESGNADAFTYPILFALFILMIFLIKQRDFLRSNTKLILILFISFFTFMWMLLTAGIIWYGYPMIALSILLVVSSLAPKKYKTDGKEDYPIWVVRSKRIFGLISIGIFIMLSMVYRMSNYKYNNSDQMATAIFDLGEMKYQSGRQNKTQVLNGFFQGGFNEAIQKINQEEESLIYRVGTVLPYFVRKNDKRVFMDNQLQNFERLRLHFKDKNTLIEVLKAAGYKYIFVDLMTYTVDQTPEKTLETKYKEFMRVLYQNPKVTLLATNRRTNTSKDPQKPKPGYGVFGAPLPNYHGNYAIFELLE